MAKRRIRQATEQLKSDYPTLKEHVASRRRFLSVAGVSLATSGILAACSRGLGHHENNNTDASVPQPDARPPQPDADVTILCDIEEPQYFLLRIPLEGDLYSYLSDGGYCTFWVELATYSAPAYDTLRYNMELAQEACRIALADYTYDGLNTAAGVAGAEDDCHSALDELVMELHNHTAPTIEALTLTITYLEPEGQLDGGIGMPDYP